MSVTIDRGAEEPFNRLLRREARYALAGEQPSDRAQELQVDERRCVHVSLSP